MKLIPRDYQNEAADATVENLLGKGKGLVVAPVGSGKTLIFSLVAKRLGEPLLVIAHNKELVQQNYEAAIEMGIEGCEIYCAGLDRKDIGTVTFCTVKSAKANPELFKDFNYALIDEGDYMFPTDKNSEYHTFFQTIGLKSYAGFTGTPYSLSSYQFGTMLKVITRMKPKNFSKVIYHVTVKKMVEEKYWSKIDYKIYPYSPDDLELHTNGTEFDSVSIQTSLKGNNTNNNAYVLVKKLLAKGEQDIVLFCENIDTAETFVKNIPEARILTSKTKKKDRKEAISLFKSGEIKVLVNVGVLVAGFNHPRLKYVILAAPTNSIRKYIQMTGRLVRKHPDKESGILVDFCGNVQRFGPIENIDIKQLSNGKYQLFCDDKLLSAIYDHQIGDVYINDDNSVDIPPFFPRLDLKYEWEKMPVGNKFKGKPLKYIPYSYLKWFADKEFAPDVVKKYLKIP
jgi:DNA repair protein RadD